MDYISDELSDLIQACVDGDAALAEQLLAHGEPVDAVDAYGWTALVWAVMQGHAHIVSLLLRCGADINHRDIMGNSVWDIAKQNGREMLLLDAQLERLASIGEP